MQALKNNTKDSDFIFEEDNRPKTETDNNTADRIVIKIKTHGIANTIYDWMSSIIIAFVIVVILLTFVFRLIDVDGTSMEPTLIDTDKVIVTNLFYEPHNGDIVVISHGQEYDKPLVKRVIAIAGQKLRIDFDKREVYVDDKLLDEPYIQGETIKGNGEIPEVVPEGKVFVMGDNRTVSLDSRYTEVGLIDEDAIIGKAQFVLIPHKLSSNDGRPVLDMTGMRYLY